MGGGGSIMVLFHRRVAVVNLSFSFLRTKGQIMSPILITQGMGQSSMFFTFCTIA